MTISGSGIFLSGNTSSTNLTVPVIDPSVYVGVAVFSREGKRFQERSKPYSKPAYARAWVTRKFKTHDSRVVFWVEGYLEKSVKWERLEW